MIENSAALDARPTVPLTPASELSRLIFVGGSPRSGTTLVQRILNCHPEIYGGPEFCFVPELVDLFQDMREAIRSGRIDAILTEQGLADAFRGLLIALLLPKLQSEGVTYISEKTPQNVLAFAWLEEYVPEAKKILVLRDPRDVVSSMLEVGRRQRQRLTGTSDFTEDTVGAVNFMNQCVKAGTELAESSANCLVVYYENLVSNPLIVANEMYRFVGVSETDQLDLGGKQFELARSEETWLDWHLPGTISGPVQKDRIGLAERRLKWGDSDYISLKTIRHPLLTERYSIRPVGWTVGAWWCVVRSVMLRIKERLPRFLARVPGRLTE
jgi:hypothetical protein